MLTTIILREDVTHTFSCRPADGDGPVDHQAAKEETRHLSQTSSERIDQFGLVCVAAFQYTKGPMIPAHDNQPKESGSLQVEQPFVVVVWRLESNNTARSVIRDEVSSFFLGL